MPLDMAPTSMPTSNGSAPIYGNSGATISSSKSNWGGPRVNSGGPRANSGGPRPNSGGSRPGAGRKRKPLTLPPPLIQPTAGLRWHVLVTQRGADTQVATAVRDLGFAGLCLQRLIPESLARKRSDGRPMPPMPAHLSPVLPGYQFVAFDVADPSWRAITQIRGVDRILGSGPERPTPIPDGSIEALQAQADERGVIMPPAPALPLSRVQTGAEVRIVNGLYADLAGICRWSSKRREEIVLTTLGLRVQVARELVEVVLWRRSRSRPGRAARSKPWFVASAIQVPASRRITVPQRALALADRHPVSPRA